MMKRFWFICILYSVLCLPMLAVDYCAPSSWGYAGNVTGGSAAPTLVTNESQLASALNTKNSVIIITQDIIVTNHISTDKDNLTILALPGKKLISNKQNATESGILYLKGNNLLLRNLTLVGPGAYDCDGWDLLCLDKATNVWVDHCDFQDGCDGNFDIKGKSDNITVTWCRFRYLKEPKAGGSFATTAYKTFKNPVALEEIKADAGLDIGGTLIGMHLKRVAVPVRLSVDHIGSAILLAARTRPKYIGGERAVYDDKL